MNIVWKGAHANNYMQGRTDPATGKTYKPRLIVCHWIVGTLAAADATFQDGKRKASAHYGIGKTAVHQYVKEADTAFTNGNWISNLESVTIEHEGGPNMPIDELTYQTSGRLVADIATRYNIPLDREHIRGHREISNTQCPGTLDIDRIISIAKGGGSMDEQMTISKRTFNELITKLDKFEKEIVPGKDSTITSLNGTINQKNNDISKLNDDKTTLENRLRESKERVSELEEIAKTVPGLKTELEQATEDRKKHFEALVACEKKLTKPDFEKVTIGELLGELTKKILRIT